MKQCKKTQGAFGKWVRLGWSVGAGGCILGHGCLLHIRDLCLVWLLVSWIGQSRVLQGKKLWSKADLQWFELKQGRLNAPHEAGSSLWSVLAQANAQRLCGSSTGFASLCGLPWQSTVEVHALSWNMLMPLKMLPAEKSLLALLGRQWIGGYWEIFIGISLINLS